MPHKPGQAYVQWLRNANGSLTFYVRHYDQNGNAAYERIGRTVANPSRRAIEALRRIAHERREQIKKDLSSLGRESRCPSVTIAHAIDTHLQDLQRSWQTKATHERVLAMFLRFMAEHPDLKAITETQHLSPRCTNEWRLARQNGSPLHPWMTTISGPSLVVECSVLSAFVGRLYDKGWIRQAWRVLPRGESVRLLQRPPAHVPSNEEVRSAVCSAQGNRAIILRLLASTGLRAGEARSIPLAGFDPGARTLQVPYTGPETTKRHARILPIGPALAEALAGPTGRTCECLLVNAAGAPLSSLAPCFKGTGMRPHDLRRWFQTRLELAGCPQHLIDDVMGHVPSKVRAAYSNGLSAGEGIAPEATKERVEQARPFMEGIEGLLCALP